VVGFDDIVTAAYTVPPLTTVRIDKGAVMAASLDALLTAQSDSAAPPRLVPTLVVRHSTTRAPA
jgi:DNA-binding LacI/PurR family transcriptional regulator